MLTSSSTISATPATICLAFLQPASIVPEGHEDEEALWI
jgi:hypothetical protein